MRQQLNLLLACLLFTAADTLSQQLTFSKPVPLQTNAKTDQPVSVSMFEEKYYLSYKTPGNTGNIILCQMGKHHDTTFIRKIDTLSATTSFAPVLLPHSNGLHVVWVNADGVVNYLITDDTPTPGQIASKILSSKNNVKISSGINATVCGDQLILTATTTTKDPVFGVSRIMTDGALSAIDWQKIPFKDISNLPAITVLDKNSLRISWRSSKNKIQYADLNVTNSSWSTSKQLSFTTAASPTIYPVQDTSSYIFWRGTKSDNHLYYVKDEAGNGNTKANTLPADFTTNYPLSICKTDDNNFLLAFTNTDGLICLSYASNYDPRRWMEQILMPYASGYTLKDIVLPGSHDAGMSVLTATTGVQKGVINTCNTLTQIQNISNQLDAGIRMFDLRAGLYNGELFARHSSSDCVSDAMGGGFGEKLRPAFEGIKRFLTKNRKEIVLLTFSHFCPKELSPAALADSIVKYIGLPLIYQSTGKTLSSITLHELAGKVVISFDSNPVDQRAVTTGTISNQSSSFINFRREYASTNNFSVLQKQQAQFFHTLTSDSVRNNDLIRLDWQLTQSSEEAAMVCNDFQDENLNPAVNGVLLLTNVFMKHKSIVDLSLKGNRYLVSNLEDWIRSGVITKKNKPNILYVDVAGAWITDYCVDLNRTTLYR